MCGGGSGGKIVKLAAMAAAAYFGGPMLAQAFGGGASAIGAGAAGISGLGTVTAAGTAAATAGSAAAAAGAGGMFAGFGGQLMKGAAIGLGSSLVQGALTPDQVNLQSPAANTLPQRSSPQAASAPDAAVIRQQAGASMAGQGQDSTLLTGPEGLSNDKYRIGKSTLLGA